MNNKTINASFHTMNGMRDVELTVTLFSSVSEALEVMGEARTLDILNQYVIKREQVNWNARYTKQLSKELNK